MHRALLGLLLACDVPGGGLALDASDDARPVDAALDTSDAGPHDGGVDVGWDASMRDVGTDVAIADTGAPDVFDAGVDAGLDATIDACLLDDECNGLDDDCDGFIDEDGCEGCTRLEAAGVPSHVYLFCDDAKRGWDEGEDWCAGYGYRLADVQTELEHSIVWMRAQAIRDDHWWIGLRDRGGWQWTRGESAHPTNATAYNGWMSGDPGDGDMCGRMKKDADGVEATFSDGGWEGKACTDGNFVVCEVGG